MTDNTPPSDERTDHQSQSRSFRRRFLGTSALLGAGAIGAASSTAADGHNDEDDDDDHDDEMNGTDPMASVTFEDQTTGGTWVNVAEATLSDGGFVTIHDASLLDGDVFDSVIGVSEALEPGDHEGVVVKFFEDVPGGEFDRERIDDGETIIAMPHVDSNDNGTYDFLTSEGEEDGPYVDEDGAPVVNDAVVSVETDDEPEGDVNDGEDDPEDSSETDGNGLVTVAGGETVEETVDRITAAIEDGPPELVMTFDHADNAESVNEELRKTTLILFGAPTVGTPIMQENQTAGIDLPQKLLVWCNENGQVQVTYNDPEWNLVERHGVSRSESIDTMSEALANFASAGANK